MLHKSTYAQFNLMNGEAMAVSGDAEELHCLSGEIWLTEENSRCDIVLRAGQSRRLSRQGKTVVQAISTTGGASYRLQGRKDAFSPLARLSSRVRAIIGCDKEFAPASCGRTNHCV